MRRILLLALAPLMALAFASCGTSSQVTRTDGLDPSSLPEGLRADYEVFARRCSKCHSLARPLAAGIDNDQEWAIYVARMRRMSGSGISDRDAAAVLRFLHYLVVAQQTERERRGQTPPRGQAVPAEVNAAQENK